ncbi:hypothetical protein CERSUDRAFT_148013 [Gelatoporia subvermispora B]|uniref:Putative gamma-glutamylcyclotransferase n=1 Tax=Ceriporiopsis subvermispora (strain B) TaxID=914234 RepID=M2RCW7_CERS8|nr:hypothetical protein CERSUDRAFT_148013 [Gelatoporia subvermispora B]
MPRTSAASSPIQPVFVYGTLMAAPVMAWVLKGDAERAPEVLEQRKPGRIHGYRRFSLDGCDFPALRPGDGSVDGYVIFPKDSIELARLDTFEGPSYERTTVKVHLADDSTVDATVYLWRGDEQLLCDSDWDFEAFMGEKLADWLEVYQGMTLTM